MNTRSLRAVPLIFTVIMILATGCGISGGTTTASLAADRPEEPDITVAAIPAVDLDWLKFEAVFAAQRDRLEEWTRDLPSRLSRIVRRAQDAPAR